jgi:hypothetical protein
MNWRSLGDSNPCFRRERALFHSIVHILGSSRQRRSTRTDLSILVHLASGRCECNQFERIRLGGMLPTGRIERLPLA